MAINACINKIIKKCEKLEQGVRQRFRIETFVARNDQERQAVIDDNNRIANSDSDILVIFRVDSNE